MKQRITAFVAVVCLLAVCLLSGCGDDGSGRGFRFPLDAEPRGLDPQMATDDAAITVTATLFEGLARLDAEGKAVPGAATWTVSKDGLTYTFTLAESYWSAQPKAEKDSPWAKPTPVTADDFVFGLQRVVDPQSGSPLAGELYGIQNAKQVHTGKATLSELGVKALDKQRLTITLTKPDKDFPSRLATTPFMPCNRQFFTHTAGRYGLEDIYLITNGPFRLAAWNHDESLLLYKHEDYHAADEVAPEAVRYVINPENPAELLETGGLDAAPLTAKPKDSFGGSYLALEDSVRCLWMNTKADPFTLSATRLALRDSIEWDTVNGYLTDTAKEQPAAGFIPPAAVVSGSDTYRRADNALPYKTSPKTARANLKKATRVLYPDGGKVSFELIAADDPVSADLARYILQSWQKNLKIYPTLTLVSQQELKARVVTGNYQAALYTHTPSGLTGAENLSCYQSGAVGNLANLRNKRVNAAIQGAKSGGRTELTGLEKALWAAAPAIPLSYPVRYVGIAADTQGIVARPFDGGRYSAPLYFREARKWD